MAKSIREFKNSPMEQGKDEIVAYTVNTATWPGSGAVTGLANVLKDMSGQDVSATHLEGAVAVDGNGVITTSLVKLLEADKKYRLEVKWVKSGNTFEAFGIIDGRE